MKLGVNAMTYKAYVFFSDGTCRQWTGLRLRQAKWRYNWLLRNAYKLPELKDWQQITWESE